MEDTNYIDKEVWERAMNDAKHQHSIHLANSIFILVESSRNEITKAGEDYCFFEQDKLKSKLLHDIKETIIGHIDYLEKQIEYLTKIIADDLNTRIK